MCSACDQLLYRHSVVNADVVRKHTKAVINTVLTHKVSADNVEWVCITCAKYLRRGEIPPLSMANHLEFPEIPHQLPKLSLAEWRLLSPRIAFMRVMEMPMGKQLKI